MRVFRLFLASLLVLVAGAAPTLAQDAASGTGAVEGIITDPQQVPLPGATVEILSASLSVSEYALTDADGRYRITGLPPAADYVLKVSYPGGGYATVTQDRIVVKADRTTPESVQLFEERTEEVIVSAKANQDRVVNLKEVGQKTEFTAEFIEGLPLLGRNYQDILTLAAGVVDPDNDGNPNVLGARAENFNTIIDGVSNQDPLGGTFLSNLNTDAIEQVEVIQTGADASFRRASGGFANIITKSGSNEFEGTFTLTFRSNLFDGNGATGNEEADFTVFRPAITVSGALKKDRLWYFLQSESFNDEFPVNTLSGRNTLITKVSGNRYLGKLTWALNSSNKLTAQVRGDPLEFTNLGVNSLVLEEAGFTQEQGGPFTQLQLDTVFSPTVLLKSLVAFQDTGVSITPNTPQDPSDLSKFTSRALNINLDTGAQTGSWFLEFEDQRQRLTVSEDLTFFVDDFFGRHDLATGISYEREFYQQDIFQGMVRTFRRQQTLFGAGDDLEGGGETFTVNEQFGIPSRDDVLKAGLAGFNQLEGESDNYGVYLTDTWLPMDNLSITAGLRWDREELSADGFEPFDPRQEFNEWVRFLAECGDPSADGLGPRAEQLVAERFPEEWAAYSGLGQGLGSCGQARGFFFTFPKERFTNDCIDGGRVCTETLSGLLPILQVVGNRPPAQIDVDNTNLSPRFNISWDPWSNGKTKFFGSWGRFYDKTNLATIVAEQGPDTRSRRFTFTTGCASDDADSTCGVARDTPGGSDPTINLVNRDLRTSFNEEWTVGFEREIAAETKIRITWVSRRFRDQLQDVDFNHYVRDVGPEFRAPVTRQVGAGGSGQVVGFVPAGGEAFCGEDPTDGVDGFVPTFQRGFNAVTNGQIVSIGTPAAVPNGEADDCFGTFTTTDQGTTVAIADGLPDLFRRNLFFNNILFLSNLNYSEFEGFTIEFTRRLKRNWQLQASWTYGRAIGAADNFQDQSGNDPSLVADEFGFTSFDIRNVVTVNVTTILPWGDVQLGGIMRYFSGTPYSIREFVNAADNRGQSVLRTEFPTGQRNDQRNDPNLQIDLLVEKSFLIKKYNATATLLVQNLLADDFLTITNFVDGNFNGVRSFGRQYEARFKLNF